MTDPVDSCASCWPRPCRTPEGDLRLHCRRLSGHDPEDQPAEGQSLAEWIHGGPLRVPPPEPVSGRIDPQDVLAALQAMTPEERREAVQDIIAAGLPAREIPMTTGMSQSASPSRQARIRSYARRLVELLKTEEEDAQAAVPLADTGTEYAEAIRRYRRARISHSDAQHIADSYRES